MNASSKQDSNGVRTAQDLERKYDFASLLGLRKNIQLHEQTLTKVSNELNNMLNSLIINLEDVLDSQSEISLWFFSGMPTEKNKPYTDWEDKTQHYGDLYYDQLTGYVYKFNSEGWNINEDTNLIQAMALTNVELDVTTDHERKVYFAQPEVPYSSGDWWILEDGTLKICQLGRTDGRYNSNDFVVSSKYTSTLATKTDNTITVLKGTVTTLSENAVTFEDLATGGKTSINGANIDTGNINTDNVSIGNGNVTINKSGILLNNGAKVVGEYGMATNLIFQAMDWKELGYSICVPYMPEYEVIDINAFIPNNFIVVSAYLVAQFHPVKWGYQSQQQLGYCRDINLYYKKLASGKVTPINIQLASELYDFSYKWLSNNTNAFSYSGSSDSLVTYTSKDLSSFLTKGQATSFQLRTSKSVSTFAADETWGVYDKNRAARTGYARAMLNVYGYMQYS